jgi:hypothetical protein
MPFLDGSIFAVINSLLVVMVLPIEYVLGPGNPCFFFVAVNIVVISYLVQT